MPGTDQSAVSVEEAEALFADWKTASVLLIAVSGGPDSVALMWLLARWRKTLAQPPDLIAATVNHGLRPEAAREARDVKQLADQLGLPHRTLRWTGEKPATGLPAAAREARYRLLAKAARRSGAQHILMAHTRDDQAETVLMRMARGSGLAGLSAMAREAARDGVVVVRPLLDVPKARLIATLNEAGIAFAIDPTNADPDFTRPRLRALMPTLAAEGFDSRNLARLATRLARANTALELMVDGAERYLHTITDPARAGVDAAAFASLADEIRIRLLLRMINRVGHEGPAELGKIETLLAAIDAAGRRVNKGVRLKQTLAGAVVSLTHDRLRVEPAPSRRGGK
jgi:tRNA(Ile)-lysidine synthase